MDNLYIEAYKFYKNDYAHGLVLFHIQSHFEAYEVENTLLFLVQIGISVNTIEYRDENGVFAIPKVKQILDDIEADY